MQGRSALDLTVKPQPCMGSLAQGLALKLSQPQQGKGVLEELMPSKPERMS